MSPLEFGLDRMFAPRQAVCEIHVYTLLRGELFWYASSVRVANMALRSYVMDCNGKLSRSKSFMWKVPIWASSGNSKRWVQRALQTVFHKRVCYNMTRVLFLATQKKSAHTHTHTQEKTITEQINVHALSQSFVLLQSVFMWALYRLQSTKEGQSFLFCAFCSLNFAVAKYEAARPGYAQKL